HASASSDYTVSSVAHTRHVHYTNSQCDRFISHDVRRRALDWTRAFKVNAEFPLIAMADMSEGCDEYIGPSITVGGA
ncbi:hypothetical protein, partial [Yoonia sp.]|uniref:hypothetical protein n=1 Tax=Yoonia sp. TaxID=2212373 RepID=UPI00239CFD69